MERKKKKREKTGQGKGGRLMSMEESNNSIHRVQKSHLLHSKTRNREASIVIWPCYVMKSPYSYFNVIFFLTLDPVILY